MKYRIWNDEIEKYDKDLIWTQSGDIFSPKDNRRVAGKMELSIGYYDINNKEMYVGDVVEIKDKCSETLLGYYIVKFEDSEIYLVSTHFIIHDIKESYSNFIYEIVANVNKNMSKGE